MTPNVWLVVTAGVLFGILLGLLYASYIMHIEYKRSGAKEGK